MAMSTTLSPSVPRFTQKNGQLNNYFSLKHGICAVLYKGRGSGIFRWLRSGNNNNTHNAYYLSSAGGFSNNNVNYSFAVRPALHSTGKRPFDIPYSVYTVYGTD